MERGTCDEIFRPARSIPTCKALLHAVPRLHTHAPGERLAPIREVTVDAGLTLHRDGAASAGAR